MQSALCLITLLSLAYSQLIIGGIGDSISTGLNSNAHHIGTEEDDLPFPVEVLDQSCGRSNPSRVWGAMLDDTFEGVLSYAEQAGAVSADNQATNDATMLSSFTSQATALASFLHQSQSSRTLILMGHSDMCTAVRDKSATCSSPDQDPNNYCRTTAAAFEREFRKGLDELVAVNNTEIIVFAPLRYSQICNFADRGHTSSSILGTSRNCEEFWSQSSTSTFTPPCTSLTYDCSTERINDAYNTQLSYLQILQKVTTEYKGIAPGGSTQSGVKIADGVKIIFRDDLWNLQFTMEDVSSCDCFHPSRAMQQKIANITAGQLVCSGSILCCDDSTPAACSSDPTISGANGVYHPALIAIVLSFLLRLLQ